MADLPELFSCTRLSARLTVKYVLLTKASGHDGVQRTEGYPLALLRAMLAAIDAQQGGAS